MKSTVHINDNLKKGIQQSLNLSIEDRMAFIANLIIDKLEIESSINTASVDEKIVVEDVSK